MLGPTLRRVDATARSTFDSVLFPVRFSHLPQTPTNIGRFIYCGITVVDSFSALMRHSSTHALGPSLGGFAPAPCGGGRRARRSHVHVHATLIAKSPA